MDRLDTNSYRSSALSLDPSLPRSETSSPSVSDRPSSRQSSHEMSDDDAESKSSILRRSPLMGKNAVQHIAGFFQQTLDEMSGRVNFKLVEIPWRDSDIGSTILPPAGLVQLVRLWLLTVEVLLRKISKHLCTINGLSYSL